jgi:hypothetical protein
MRQGIVMRMRSWVEEKRKRGAERSVKSKKKK